MPEEKDEENCSLMAFPPILFFPQQYAFFFLPFSSLSGWLEHKLSIISSVTIFIFCFFSNGDSFFFLQIKIDDFVFRLLFKQSFMGLLVVSVVYCFGNDLQMQFIWIFTASWKVWKMYLCLLQFLQWYIHPGLRNCKTKEFNVFWTRNIKNQSFSG